VYMVLNTFALIQQSCSASGTVTTWMGDCLLTGKGKVSQPSRSTQPSIPPGYVNRVPACLAGVTAWCVHLCRVTGNTV